MGRSANLMLFIAGVFGAVIILIAIAEDCASREQQYTPEPIIVDGGYCPVP
jgi:hypothetical protein